MPWTAALVGDVMRRSFMLANQFASDVITSECVLERTADDGTRWYDTRPMLDPREHTHANVDLHTEALAYALQTGLVIQHPAHAHLVRLANPSTH